MCLLKKLLLAVDLVILDSQKKIFLKKIIGTTENQNGYSSSCNNGVGSKTKKFLNLKSQVGQRSNLGSQWMFLTMCGLFFSFLGIKKNGYLSQVLCKEFRLNSVWKFLKAKEPFSKYSVLFNSEFVFESWND